MVYYVSCEPNFCTEASSMTSSTSEEFRKRKCSVLYESTSVNSNSHCIWSNKSKSMVSFTSNLSCKYPKQNSCPELSGFFDLMLNLRLIEYDQISETTMEFDHFPTSIVSRLTGSCVRIDQPIVF